MSHVTCEVRDRVAHVVLARLDKKNALTAAMYQALSEALARAAADPQVRAVVIRGTETCFSAGNDLKDFLDHPPQGDDAPVARFLQAISTAPKPLVAAVGGPAVGIGTTMLLHCDFVYATPEARFQLPFVALGLVPEAASSLLLPRAAGYLRAAELLLLGRPFGADKALAAGVVTEVVPQAELIARAEATAEALAQLPPGPVQATKRLMKQGDAPAVAARILAERDLFRAQLASPEAKEAFTAFFEKRTPDFSKF